MTVQDYEKRKSHFETVKANILLLLSRFKDGLPFKQIMPSYLDRFGYAPRIDNRLRELRRDGFITSSENKVGILLWKLTEKGRRRVSELVREV